MVSRDEVRTVRRAYSRTGTTAAASQARDSSCAGETIVLMSDRAVFGWWRPAPSSGLKMLERRSMAGSARSSATSGPLLSSWSIHRSVRQRSPRAAADCGARWDAHLRVATDRVACRESRLLLQAGGLDGARPVRPDDSRRRCLASLTRSAGTLPQPCEQLETPPLAPKREPRNNPLASPPARLH